MKTEAQRKAKNTYRAKGYRITIDFYPTELDLAEHIKNQEAKQTYIKNLIREDMKKGDQN